MIEIVRKVLPGEFRRVDTRRARVILVEGGPRLLPTFPRLLRDAPVPTWNASE